MLLHVLVSLSPTFVEVRPLVAEDSVDALVQRGRALLDEGRAEDALPLFEQASRQDGAKFRTHVWVLRTKIALGSVEDALAEVDQARTAGATGPDVDYAYGIGFEDMARRVPDVRKLERVIGYRPRTTLDQIIDDVVAEQRAALAAGRSDKISA